jgi:modulator of FtsH protease HflK
MAWNEPGGGNKDPWSGRSGGDQGPPDLEEVVRKLQERLGGLFGGGKSGGSFGPGFGGIGSWLLLAIVGALLLVWAVAGGAYIVEPAYNGVVTRFGRYVETTGPGWHWHLPFPIETVEKVNVGEVSTFSHQAAMLTREENIVDVELTVQSQIGHAADYLFRDQDPKRALKDATETVLREAVGENKLDYVLTDGRGHIQDEVQKGVQALMEKYKTGLDVKAVNLRSAKAPEAVKEAFDDAIKAREDKERLENQAEAYSNQVLPQARGEAARIVADAKAYRDKVVAESEGEAARFSAVLAEYKKAPDVTRERLYLDTMEQVLRGTNKVVMDVQEGASSLIYLPLDQLMQKRPVSGAPAAAAAPPVAAQPPEPEPRPAALRPVDRERRVR